MSLLNVRLTKADQEAVRILKRSHVEISKVVREALHREAEKHRPRSSSFTSKLLADIFDEYPDPVGAPRRAFDVHDRRAFADAFNDHRRTRRSRRSK